MMNEDQEEYLLDQVNGGHKKKKIMSGLNKKKVSVD